ncbi:methylenetetrahydrofolate reductase [NAD(P)H] [Rhizobium sp. L1K21]|uniref:methylenetetrahydrofolate reductase [NAD(P)H] n=1 Tax=Rhizobium sp. L1K21 TaxID=2954933 RepID=UPI00209254E3|nr:methylenetetrahydrofolate reductase [NAD(P)H] [Rhizobium sp. L1K21]MCO6185618.1 methylenetetrahydrofolate reductase [NAD(P)H] [Rhizobium sp. L1K21]
MSGIIKANADTSGLTLSFEFFPPKTPEMESQLWEAVDDLAGWAPSFVSVTYGAGGSTKAPTLCAVSRIASQTTLTPAAHLTCVGAACEEVDAVVAEFAAAGVKHFVALRGDPAGGIGTAYVPHPNGYANGAELVAGLKRLGDYEISVSAYPEKHPESADVDADIDMLKRKVDNGATRALTQFFFDNDHYERYLERVRAAGIDIPIVPGILPVHNLAQVRKFAGMAGASVPDFVVARLGTIDDDSERRFVAAAALAAEQVQDLIRRGVTEFHFYTMNRSALVSEVLRRSGFRRTDVAA